MLTNQRALVGAIIVMASAVCFGTLGPASRLAYDAGMSPLGFVSWRAGLGACLMLGVVATRWTSPGARRPPGGARGAAWPPLRETRNLLIAAASGFLLNLAIFEAFSRVPVAIALLGFYTYPAMVAATDFVIHGERLDRVRGVALGLALAGMVLVVASQLDPSAGVAFDLVGFGLALVAAGSQTVYIAISRHGYPSVSGDQVIAVVMLLGALGYVATAAATGVLSDLAFPFREVSIWPLILFAGFAGGGIPALLFLTGVRWIGGTRTSILALIEPVTGVVLAALLLGEALHPVQILGGVLILTAAALLQRSPQTNVDGAARSGRGGSAEEAGEPEETPAPLLV